MVMLIGGRDFHQDESTSSPATVGGTGEVFRRQGFDSLGVHACFIVRSPDCIKDSRLNVEEDLRKIHSSAVVFNTKLESQP